ncbi:hypothetical protein [Methylobacterium sp. WL8]|uniref:hypothetical protein n=1 Tax=Methylobacterium sp. WL8 TaxID=2603899 RepID=UPI0011CB6E37|nr:hypothetical protein [Methylobacterium sp. WL8]TXN73943.1 hypothetical protein FV234_25555 [Methylobacterium sp. WL8]
MQRRAATRRSGVLLGDFSKSRRFEPVLGEPTLHHRPRISRPTEQGNSDLIVMPQSTIPVPDLTISRDWLKKAVQAGECRRRHLVPLPHDPARSRLLVLRSYATAAKADEARSLIYLGLAPPVADP